MEKVSFKIAQRDYSLKTDEDPQKITKLAGQLEHTISYVARKARGMNEVEITTLASMILICDMENTFSKDSISSNEAKRLLEESEKNLKEQLRSAQDAAADHERQVKQLTERLSELDGELEKQKKSALSGDAEKENKIKELTQKLTDTENKLREHIEAATNDIEEKERLLKEADNKLSEAEESLLRMENEQSADSAKRASEQKAEVERLNAEILSLKSMAESAESQFEQLAVAKDEEAQRLRLRVQEYENELKTVTQQQEKEIEAVYDEHERECRIIAEKRDKELSDIKDEYVKSVELLKKQLDEQRTENEKMKKTLSNYEATFDMYVKNKENELKQAYEETEAVKSKNADLEKQLARSGDIQMTIC